ncbi:MAG TPA: CARDB domain-containing protein, partial [Verrucomicrobiota bacterium]|nr:CARDB domain-containing protein [Verrucomicrobiota bacterium]
MTVWKHIQAVALLPFMVTVIIPAGQNTAPFLVAAAEDTLVEGDKSYTITASAVGHLAGVLDVTVQDDDVPLVTLAFSKTTLSEGDGSQAAVGTVSRGAATDRALTIRIEPDAMGLLLPLDVEIPASAVSASFAIGVVDNTTVDGLRQLEVRGLVLESGGDRVLSVTETVGVTITDDDGPTLKVAFDRALVKEGLDPAAHLTVSRNTDPTEPLVVELLCGDEAELTVPSVVTIPAGQTSVTVGVASLDDGVTDGSKMVTVTARAAGYTEGIGTIVVSDMNLPDLAVTKVEGAAEADTESFVSLTYRVENQGAQPAGPQWATRLFLSDDPIPGDDLLVGTYDFVGTIPPGQYYEQSVSVRMPTRAGDYWVVAEVDVAGQISETIEDNNRRIAAQPIRVQSAYLATVATEIETALANTPIPLTGWAVRSNGLPASEGSFVNIHVYVRGTHRVISALVDRQGRFATTWQPLPNEAGFYEIGAAHPGEADAPVQDTFLLVGMSIEPAESDLRIVEGSSVKGQLRLVNLSIEPLTGLSWNVIEAPANLTLSGELSAASLPPLGEVVISYTVTAHDASMPRGTIRLRVESVQGAVAEAGLDVSVEALRPRLATEPDRLRTGMPRGVARTVEFTVSNLGGLASGPLNVVLPTVDWMTVVTPSPLPSLEPGDSTQVSLLLTPPADLALGPYGGSLHVGNDSVGINVPFTFRAISEAIGDLRLTAVDELTFYAEGSPKLAGAAVVVRDPVTQTEVAGGLTDASGEFFAAGLPENYYEIEVTAEKHSVYKGTHLLVPGEVNEVRAFLSRQTVTYSWTVKPIEVEDRYHIEIETTFETVVPLPVVTVEPSVIDLALITASETQVDIKITNHGLIAANNTRLSVPTHPLWEFTPLIEQIGVLPAKSSLTIPLTIRKLSPAVALASQPGLTDGGGGPCHTSVTVCWELVCGPQTYTICAGVFVANARSGCEPPSFRGWVGGGGGGGGGGVNIVAPSHTTPVDCDPCMLEASLNCLIGLVPVLGDAMCFADCVEASGGVLGGTVSDGDWAETCFGCLLPGPASCVWDFFRCKCNGPIETVGACAWDLFKDGLRQTGLLSASGGSTGVSRAALATTITVNGALEYYAGLSYPVLAFYQLILDDPEGRWLESDAQAAGSLW